MVDGVDLTPKLLAKDLRQTCARHSLDAVLKPVIQFLTAMEQGARKLLLDVLVKTATTADSEQLAAPTDTEHRQAKLASLGQKA